MVVIGITSAFAVISVIGDIVIFGVIAFTAIIPITEKKAKTAVTAILLLTARQQ